MNLFLSRNKYPLLLALIFIASEVIVNPIGEFPLNDDWSYAKSVLILMKEGDVYIGTWCAMTLASHVVWGFLFTKILGFSFTVLRLSNLISSLIGILVLNKLASSISKNKTIGFVAALALLFNPIYFNLSNTFMTDINFNTWMIIGVYFAYRFFESRKTIYFALVFLMSVILVLNRQFGIVLPFCFMIANLFTAQKKWLYTALSLFCGLAVLAVFKWYESYLYKVLPDHSAYKIFNKVSLADKDFVERTSLYFMERYKAILIHMLLYSAPLAYALYYGVAKGLKIRTVILVALINLALVVPFFYSVDFPTGNILTNTSLGPNTFYGSKDDYFHPERSHTYSQNMAVVFCYVKLALILCSTIVLSLHFVKRISIFKSGFFSNTHPLLIMLLALSAAYVMLLFVSSSFFDRYNVPLITLFLILLSFVPSFEAIRTRNCFPLILLFFYVSVMGTKDYLTWNRERWKAVDVLKEEKNAAIDKINGGFEVNCWSDGHYNWWADYINLDNYDYLIQYGPEPGFELYKELEFQRYFPYKKDKINIFVRKDTLGTAR